LVLSSGVDETHVGYQRSYDVVGTTILELLVV
jgi:hypothetical protein